MAVQCVDVDQGHAQAYLLRFLWTVTVGQSVAESMLWSTSDLAVSTVITGNWDVICASQRRHVMLQSGLTRFTGGGGGLCRCRLPRPRPGDARRYFVVVSAWSSILTRLLPARAAIICWLQVVVIDRTAAAVVYRNPRRPVTCATAALLLVCVPRHSAMHGHICHYRRPTATSIQLSLELDSGWTIPTRWSRSQSRWWAMAFDSPHSDSGIVRQTVSTTDFDIWTAGF